MTEQIVVCAKIAEEQVAEIDGLAKKLGCTRQTFLRNAITAYLKTLSGSFYIGSQYTAVYGPNAPTDDRQHLETILSKIPKEENDLLGDITMARAYLDAATNRIGGMQRRSSAATSAIVEETEGRA